jgi:hypothetical protein
MLHVATPAASLPIATFCIETPYLGRPEKMLFKTISASGYGIDAYLVEVEVDVGSARMQDFNVVGLPDNAVKESRERIKSALRNCGFEFPYGQGVTINLAPADYGKKAQASICPWPWDWTAGSVQCAERFRPRLRHATRD